MTVYVVTAGEYSDYRIVAVFTTREQAEAFCVRMNGPEVDGSGNPYTGSSGRHGIEEYTANAYEEPEGGAYWISLKPDGSVEYGPHWVPDAPPTKPAERSVGYRGVETFVGYGPTIEHARRSAEELRRAVKAGTIVP